LGHLRGKYTSLFLKKPKNTQLGSRIAIRLFSFNKILLFIKKLAFDGFYPLLVVLKKSIFVVVLKLSSVCHKK